MKGRKQKISGKETWPQKNRTESEGYVGGQTFMWITENNLTDNNRLEYGMLEFILSPSNLNAAYKQVKRNKGAAGVDKMDVESPTGCSIHYTLLFLIFLEDVIRFLPFAMA